MEIALSQEDAGVLTISAFEGELEDFVGQHCHAPSQDNICRGPY